MSGHHGQIVNEYVLPVWVRAWVRSCGRAVVGVSRSFVPEFCERERKVQRSWRSVHNC